MRRILLLAILVISIPALSSANDILVSADPSNDLVSLFKINRVPHKVFSTPDQAIKVAKRNDGVMILAQDYPNNQVTLSAASIRRIRSKNLKIFIEYPRHIPGLSIAPERKRITLERGVINTSEISPLDSLSLLAIHDHEFLQVENITSLIVLSKVAGFSKADYGISDTRNYPLLFRKGNYLISSTKISDVISSRFGPAESWKHVWNFILKEIGGRDAYRLDTWAADVRPTYTATEKLPANAVHSAVVKGSEWFYNARLFIHPDWRGLFEQRTKKNGEHVVYPGPDKSMPLGDGSQGILEGHASFINADGSQPYRWWLRADVQAEVAWALSSSSRLLNNEKYKSTANNLLKHLYTSSNLRAGERNDPKSPSFGLIGWATTDPDAYYGDDNARAILATIGASVNLNISDWDDHILEAIIGNYRTTGIKGFRGPWFRDAAMQKTTWEALSKRDIVNVHPHYESWLWACNFWLYDKTGYRPLLEQTKEAITITMAAHPNWKWTNGIQQEYARMILPLAWLVRIEDTPQHRQWLSFVVNKLIEDMDKSGAIAEELGPKGLGRYDKIASNAEYGTKEAPLISDNGDPVADMLYTVNFAFFALNEAAAATNDPAYREAAGKLASFLLRIQIDSEKHSDLNGAWVRAFDFNQWDYWASNADSGWGPWGTLTGWTQSWILNGLMLHQQNESLWDTSGKVYKTEEFRIKAQRKLQQMLGRSTR